MLKDVFLDDKTQGVRKTTNPSTLNLVHYKPEAFNCGVSGPRGLLFSIDNHPELSPTRRSLSRWLNSPAVPQGTPTGPGESCKEGPQPFKSALGTTLA